MRNRVGHCMKQGTMIQTEQILEYIDGQLDTESEQELFDVLARQPDLRSALRQYISIGQAVHADREAYTPPAEVERSLLAGLGFTASDLGFASATVGILARLGAMFTGRLWGFVDAFVLGVVVTGALFFVTGSDRGSASAERSFAAAQVGSPVAGANGTRQATGSSNDRGGNGSNTVSNSHSGSAGAPTGLGVDSTAQRAGGNAAPQYGASVQREHASQPSIASTSRSGNTPRMQSARSFRSNVDARRSRVQQAVTVRNRSSIADRPIDLDRAGSTSTSADARSNSEGRSNDATVARADASRADVSRTDASRTDAAGVSSDSVAERDGARDMAGNMRASASVAPRSVTTPLPSVRRTELVQTMLPEEVREHMGGANPLDIMEQDAKQGPIVELRGQAGWSLNSSKARTDVASGREAFAGGAYWSFADGIGIGAELGLESYDQTLRYNGGDTLQIDQRPQYFWGGASLRYAMNRFSLGGLVPFVQTTIGGTSVGPMVRMRLGGQYDFGGGLGATLSGEVSSLLYSFDNQRLMSGRTGITAGIFYMFR